MSEKFNWKVQERKYAAEKKQKKLYREEVTSHPLKGITVTDSKVRKTGGVGSKMSRSTSLSSQTSSTHLDPLSSALEGSDPLSQFASQAMDPLSQIASQATDPLSQFASQSADPLSQMDPLSRAAAQPGSSRGGFLGTTFPEEVLVDTDFEPWSAKKAHILSKYTTSEKLSITTSFLSATDREKVTVKTQAGTVSDKVKNRLEQLDDFEEGSVQEMLNLSQQDYVKRIEELNSALIAAWDQDQRVRALKIAIQCSKLLADISVIQFYPSKFVLITDILDTFGHLVYERIKNKATYIPKGSSKAIQLPDDFTPDQVPESAKETCRNWFFKIASIRELVPRFYVEAAILKSYSFLTSGEYNKALRRLGVMTRGIGDPLVALYSRCYLCRVGVRVAPSIKQHIMPCFDDFLYSYKQIQNDHVISVLARQKLDLPVYLTLYSPALDWLLQCLAHRASDTVLEQVLSKCKDQCNSALLINSILSAFMHEFVSSRATEFAAMIRECEDTGFPKQMLYRSLGVCLVEVAPPEEDRLPILNEVWKFVIKLKNPSDYIACAEIWIGYVVRNFGKREVNTILSDIIKHMSPDRAYEDHYPQLQNIVAKILHHVTDFSQLFALEKFLPLLDMFQKESVKVEVCKIIMDAYCKYQTEPTSDPVIINALMFICKTMHDSVNALTLDDEIRQIGHLINCFLRTVSYDRDFEQQLSFYVDSRANFSNIDAVLVFLVQCVNSLAMKTRKIVKGSHTRKTAAFVRACAAYTFITIPSLNGIFSRLNLYLVSGQVALANLCLSQGDAFFKAAISLLPEVPRSMEIDGKIRGTDSLLLEYTNNLISALLIVPDNPSEGVLCLVRGLLTVVSEYKWDPHSDTKAVILMNMIVLLSSMAQEIYPYSIDKVDSNDTLYGHDQKFLNECIGLCNTLLDDVLTYLQVLDKPEMYKRQAVLSHDLFVRLVAHGDLRHEQMAGLALRLWNLSQKHGQLDTKLSVRTIAYVKRKSKSSPHLEPITSRLAVQSRA